MRGRIIFMRFVTLVCMTDAGIISDLGKRVENLFERGKYAQTRICM